MRRRLEFRDLADYRFGGTLVQREEAALRPPVVESPNVGAVIAAI